MLRYLLSGLAALVFLTVSLVPDDAYARRGGGGGGFRGGGGFHGGGMRAGGFHGGGFRGGHGYAGRPHPSHPIAGRPGRPIAGYPGYGGGYRPGWGYGAAAIGAAAVAGAYYGGSGYDPYYEYDDGGSYVAAETDPIAECARRFKTYDPVSQTYVKRKGVRASCP